MTPLDKLASLPEAKTFLRVGIVTIRAPYRGKYSSGAGLTRQDVIGHQ